MSTYEKLLKSTQENKSSQDYTDLDLTEIPDDISHYNKSYDVDTITKHKTLNHNMSTRSYKSTRSSMYTKSHRSNLSDKSDRSHVSDMKEFSVKDISTYNSVYHEDLIDLKEYKIDDNYRINFDNYTIKLEKPYLIATKSNKSLCYRTIQTTISFHKIIDCIKPYFGLRDYKMCVSKIHDKHNDKMIRVGLLKLKNTSSSYFDTSMYVDLLSLPVDIVVDRYGVECLICMRIIFIFREIIGFKTPNSGKTLSKASIFFDNYTADKDIEKTGSLDRQPVEYVITLPETLSINTLKNSENSYIRRCITDKYLTKYFGTEHNYRRFYMNYFKLFKLDTVKEEVSKAVKQIDVSYMWFVDYIFRRIDKMLR